MARLDLSPNFTDCLTIGEAAQYLGVSTATLRNWDRAGKLKPRRHPQNGYRIYLHEDLEAVLRSADLPTESIAAIAPLFEWSQVADTEHFVQFYDSDDFLVESVSCFVRSALAQGEASVVIATLEHRLALQRQLAASGLDVAEAIESGRYVVLDASDVLARIVVDEEVDAQRFEEIVGTVLSQFAEGRRRVHAFGEMVALLWADGKIEAAIRLEELWSELGKRCRFALLCAYPIGAFNRDEHAEPFHSVCGCHTRVIPAESYTALADADQRLRAISALQHKAKALEAEIAHRREVEQSLRQRERELTDFFENATEGLSKIDADGKILWVNKAQGELFGCAAADCHGQPLESFCLASPETADFLQKLRRGETATSQPLQLQCKNGDRKHVLVSSNGYLENGQLAYNRCIARDVTQQRESEQALIEADRRKDIFLAMLAHELRNPLAPVRSALELLQGSEQLSSEASQSLGVINRQVDHMARLVDDLLDVSRISRGKIDLRTKRMDLRDAIRSAVETCRPHVDAAGHKLSVRLPSRSAFCEADPARLAQVFSNLLHNAVKYTESGGRIEIDVVPAGKEWLVRVRDNGVGIACEDIAYVFDMFQQVDKALDRSQGGLGIGLTLVRRLVELHGGTIDARSEGRGKGSEFVVKLPAASKPPITKPQSAPASQAAKQRILVVDDNKDSGDTLSMLLKLKGHDVRTARDGFEALDAVAEFQPTAILMDIGMPKMDGYEATRRIRGMPGGGDLFIVALTGWSQPADVQRTIEAGCSAHLVKPVDIEVLEQLLAGGTK